MTTLNPASASLADAFHHSESILALEGMSPDSTSIAIKNAVIAGRITGSQAVAELCEWVKAHQSLDGFIASRAWV